MKDIVIIKNSNTLLNNDVYFPDINEIENGELLLNNSADKETLFIKNDKNEIILFRSKSYTLDKINALIPTITISETAPDKPKEGDFWIEPMPPIPLTLEFTTTAENESITLPCSGDVNIIVDWGDGSVKENVTTDKPSHNYNNIGVYVVKVYGDFERMYKCSINITKVISWGNSNTLLTNMSQAFLSCSKLTSIPDDEYETFSNVTNFYLTFAYCTSLVLIPEKLFQYSFKAEQINNTFLHCSKLTSIPEKLFINCSNVTVFDSAFAFCTSITSIPENLLINNYNAINFVSMFNNCTSLTSIPENLFAKCPNITTFTRTFYHCTGLTGEIPENLFKYNTNVTTFYSTFEGCSSLTGSIPEDLFAHCPNVTKFNSTFSYCTGLIGNTPTGTDGLELWERAGQPGYPSYVSGVQCFAGCSKLSNYGSIPRRWKL